MPGMLHGRKEMERVTITPDIAFEILDANKRNRPLSQARIGRIAHQIQTGKWRYNGDTIKIAEGGNVLDGQHRLWSVIEAKMPIETIIVRGIKEDAFATIDTIRALRSGADVLSLKGVKSHRNAHAEGLKWLLRWQRGVIPSWRAPDNRIENSDVEEAFENHRAFSNAAERGSKLRRIGNPSVLAFLFYVLGNKNWELGERMFDTLMHPVKARIDDPFIQFRAYLMNAERRKDPVVTIAMAFKAANLAKAGRHTNRLRWRNQGSKPEEFPKLEV